ncbi:hypothetical protein I5M27_17190 [Adhaeribacter sp. BT258]|uniref:Curlin associated repeat-containing protein n=1 Tax=Adhaeribacter terrigena TaxID=2793070 RepID=A0ABS1C5V0_9BACT|nr:hypothetical protein [Adhaeribacter terrigena]MBK0404732.1 hypothetical protein [Adhaeribacter terrigena]
MRKFITLIIAFLAIIPVLCVAQSGKYEEELLTSQQLASERYILNNSVQENVPANARNVALVAQDGNSNTFDGKQVNAGSSRNPNVVVIMQSGNLNNASLEQTGENNKAKVSQLGEGNDYEGRMNGRNNETAINQFGNNNSINQNLEGEGMNYRLTQQGNNNQINQYENGTQNKGYEVIQQGSGMNITITNGF